VIHEGKEVVKMFDFSTNQTVENLEGVPENFRVFYGETEEGGFRVKDEDAVKAAVSTIIGLNGALRASRSEAKDAKGRIVDLSPLSGFGDNVEDINNAFAAQLEELQGKVKGGEKIKVDIEKMRQEVALQSKQAIEDKETENGKLRAQLFNVLGRNEALTAMGDTFINPDLIMPFAETQLQTVDRDGQLKVVVVDPEGIIRHSMTTGAEMTPAELVAEMAGQEKFSPLVKSKVATGSGHVPGTASNVQGRQVNVNLSPIDKIASGLRKGLAKQNR